jgi:hypothetical protein
MTKGPWKYSKVSKKKNVNREEEKNLKEVRKKKIQVIGEKVRMISN